ncbi:MAG: uracil-DNA glycosylase [Deltaproteobacteria bacterium]|nr:uracil-DNA glycosylase [Deltaproteobacteria bacterium]
MLDTIREEIGDCKRCPLFNTRANIVFGEGNPNAIIMFVGEAPGAVEDRTGKPFVGPAGRLFTDIVEKGMGLKRSDVYIANILKCRPPGNRDPLPDEIAECIGFLKEQILAIRPEVIIALGRIAAQNLLEIKTPISRLRGNLKEFMGIKVMPTYHPSYLLQNPSKKRDVWEDIKKVLKYLGLPIPQPQR